MRPAPLLRSPAARALALAALLLPGACKTTESHARVEKETVAAYGTAYTGPRYPMVVGQFANASPYLRGVFADGADRLGDQARVILKTHLSQTGRFVLADRDNLDEIAREAEISGAAQQLTGADVVVGGQVTEFGRRATTDRQLFGIGGRAKEQVAYATVSLNIVDVKTSQVVYSVQGAGEYALNDREVLGFGTSSGYDSTLNGKVLNLAILDAVDKLVQGLERGAWSPTQP